MKKENGWLLILITFIEDEAVLDATFIEDEAALDAKERAGCSKMSFTQS